MFGLKFLWFVAELVVGDKKTTITIEEFEMRNETTKTFPKSKPSHNGQIKDQSIAAGIQNKSNRSLLMY